MVPRVPSIRMRQRPQHSLYLDSLVHSGLHHSVQAESTKSPLTHSRRCLQPCLTLMLWSLCCSIAVVNWIFFSNLHMIDDFHGVETLSNNNLHLLVKTTMKIDYDKTFLPRIVYLNDDDKAHNKPWKVSSRLVAAMTSGLPLVNNTDEDYKNSTKSDCVPLADWQTGFHPQCNSVHELDLRRGLRERSLSFLGRGWFRITWKWRNSFDNGTIVVKTLRMEREFLKEYYELHRRDAVAMERLTSSPYVVNIYGYCAQTALNERANFDVAGIDSLEDLDKRMRDQYGDNVLIIKLRLAASIAQGVADIHSGGDPKATRPLLVHYDLNPRNIALFQGALPKINDFNIAEFLYYNPKTNQTCPFPSRMHTPWWRAPEEVIDNGIVSWLDHTVDIYALGNLLFHILTTHAPRGKMANERVEEARAIVASGRPPLLMEPFTTSKHHIVKAFRKAMNMCYALDPKKRASAKDVAKVLQNALQVAYGQLE